MKTLVLLFCTLAAGHLFGAAPLNTNDLFEARVQGSNSLAAFKRRLTTNNVMQLGFASTNQAQLAVLGEPFVVYQVPKARLASYAPPQDFATLLEPVSRVIFPAMVGLEAKSSVIVSRPAGAWRTDRTGGPAFISDLVGARNVLAATNAELAGQSFAVEVPVLSLWFLGYTNAANNRVELLTPIELRFGSLTNAAQQRVAPAFMMKLVDAAAAYGGLSN